MNKQEIEHRIKIHKTSIEMSTEIVAALEFQLAEAEKPKRRHGDFGIDFDKSKDGKLHFPVIAIKKWPGGSLEIIFRDGSPFSKRDEGDITWLGNIFDILKEWSEDSDDYESVDVKCQNRKILIEKSAEGKKGDIFIAVGDMDGFRGDGAHLSLTEFENLWHKLGKKIATLKRKKAT